MNPPLHWQEPLLEEMKPRLRLQNEQVVGVVGAMHPTTEVHYVPTASLLFKHTQVPFMGLGRYLLVSHRRHTLFLEASTQPTTVVQKELINWP